MNKEKPMPNAKERRNHNLTDAVQTGWTDMKTIELNGLRVSLSRPRLVARSKGYLWFPTLVQREKNELLAILSDMPDVHTDKPTGLVSWSRDGGLTWSEPVKGPYADCAPLRLPNGDLLLLSQYLYPRADGAYEGASMIARGQREVQPLTDGVTIAGWLRPIRPGSHGLAGFGFNGLTVELKEGGYLATLYGYFEDAQRFSLAAAHSEDGRHWNIRSVIADEKCAIPVTEGPCESAMCRLKDGRLMCIFRTGDSPYGQSWSQDEGKTWTTPVAMTQARAVQPSLVVMEDGMIALSGGRGGIFLWINADGTGNDWQAVDVRAHHNEFCSKEPIGNWPTTTSYTEIVPLDDEHLLMIYDRIPHGWEAIPPDSGESNSVWVVRVSVSWDAAPRAESMNKKKPTLDAKGHEPKDLKDAKAWEKLQSGPFAESDSNRYRLTQEKAGFVIESETTLPEGPGVISYGVIAIRERLGTPGLKGTLVFEVDFVDYSNNGEYLNKYMSAIGQPSDHEDLVFGNYLMGWGITIGNIKGFVTGIDDGDRKRAVQFHFDGYSKKGFFSTLCRQISTQDQQKYRRFTQTELMETGKDYFAGKETYEDWVRRVLPYRSMDDATALYSRHWPPGQGGKEGPDIVRGRFGIMLSDDGNTFSWLLDGNVMDSCDITGYFSSSTDDFAEGVYITVGGGAGFRKNTWRFANPRIRVNE